MSGWAVRELRHLLAADAETAAAGFAERAPLCLRTNTCVVTLSYPVALTMKWTCAGRIGWRPSAFSIRPTVPSLGIGYDEGLIERNTHYNDIDEARAVAERLAEERE